MTHPLIQPGPKVMGLDLMIGGAIPLLARAEHPQTAILVRGEAGSGKTVLATFLAAQLAAQLEGDVAYACVELLPIELAAQNAALYPEKPILDVVPVWSSPPPPSPRPRCWASAIELGERIDAKATQELFVTELPKLLEGARDKAEKRPIKVLVVDAVSVAYHLGASAPRMLADDVCKWAAEENVALIVVEESVTPEPSVWSFAVDLVIELTNESSPAGQRSLRVPKNRFGASLGREAAGLDVEKDQGPVIRPPVVAYRYYGPVVLSHPREWDWPFPRLPRPSAVPWVAVRNDLMPRMPADLPALMRSETWIWHGGDKMFVDDANGARALAFVRQGAGAPLVLSEVGTFNTPWTLACRVLEVSLILGRTCIAHERVFEQFRMRPSVVLDAVEASTFRMVVDGQPLGPFQDAYLALR